MNKNIFLFFALSITCVIDAQDSHYWNLQYGTKSTLLGGSVIGSVTDLSATYYNPGAVSLFNDPKVILSAKVYQYEKITVINGAGQNKDLDYSSISPSPTFVAFNVNIDKTEKNKLAFSLLTRQSMNFELEARQIETAEDVNNPDNSYNAGGLFVKQMLDEIWGGVTFSHKVSDILGIGATAYVAYRNQSFNFQTIIEGIDSANQISSFIALRNFKFNNYRALFKIGAGLNLNPITLGLTVTTPSINILGDGSYGYHNFYDDRTDPGKNVFQSNYQDDLKAKYNSSWAIGFGGAYWSNKYSVHFSVEWFNAVDKYNPLNLEPFYSQSSKEYFLKEITQQLKSVINAGFGIDYKLNDDWRIAGSFITDFSANDSNAETNLSISRWDIYHISGGSYFKLADTEITLGLSYSFGKDVIKQIAEIGTGKESDGSTVEAKSDVKFQRIKILFGFIF